MSTGTTKPQVEGIERVMEAIDRYVEARLFAHELLYHNRYATPQECYKANRAANNELRAALRAYVEGEK